MAGNHQTYGHIRFWPTLGIYPARLLFFMSTCNNKAHYTRVWHSSCVPLVYVHTQQQAAQQTCGIYPACLFYVHTQQRGSLHTRVAFILRASCFLCPHAATRLTLLPAPVLHPFCPDSKGAHYTRVWHSSCMPLVYVHLQQRAAQ